MKIHSKQDGQLLTPIQEKIIRMKAQGLMYKEIAVKLNYPLTNCTNQIHYAKQRIGVKTLTELQNLVSMNYKNWSEDLKKSYTQRWQVSTGEDLMKIYGVSQKTITSINKHLGLWVKVVDGKVSHIRKAYRKNKDSYPLGTIVYHNVNGKKRAFIITPEGRVRLHLYTWKQAGREIPEGYVLGFKDLNPENNALENLVLKTREEIARDNVRRAYPNAKAKISRFKTVRAASRVNVKAERLKAKERKENRLKVEREWQERSRKNKIVKKYPTRPVDLSQKVAVRINPKTIVFVVPGTDIEAIKRKYLKTA